MSVGLLVGIAATALALGAVLGGAGLSRGPPLRPVGSPPTVRPVDPDAPRLRVCVTARGYCTSPPRRLEDPCTCYDPWAGWVAGRIESDRSKPPGIGRHWPTRPEPEPDEPPAGTWVEAP